MRSHPVIYVYIYSFVVCGTRVRFDSAGYSREYVLFDYAERAEIGAGCARTRNAFPTAGKVIIPLLTTTTTTTAELFTERYYIRAGRPVLSVMRDIILIARRSLGSDRNNRRRSIIRNT